MIDDANTMLADAVRALFERHSPQSNRAQLAESGWAANLWNEFQEAGLSHPAVPEDHGGAGGEAHDERIAVQATGYFAAPIPAAETMLAGHVLAATKLALDAGAMSIAPVRVGEIIRIAVNADGTATLSGKATRVPRSDLTNLLVVHASDADELPYAVAVAMSDLPIAAGRNLAEEARVDITFDGVTVAPGTFGRCRMSIDRLFAHGALIRAAQIVGACERVLELSVEYAGARHQFGRNIGQFQAIQQQLAVLAEEGAAARAAVAAAYDAFAQPVRFEFVAGMAKARASEAAGVAAAVAHQVHGAIGFSMEYPLQFNTRRMMSWRSEFGNEAFWNELTGRRIAAAGGDQLWTMLAA